MKYGLIETSLDAFSALLGAHGHELATCSMSGTDGDRRVDQMTYGFIGAACPSMVCVTEWSRDGGRLSARYFLCVLREEPDVVAPVGARIETRYGPD